MSLGGRSLKTMIRFSRPSTYGMALQPTKRLVRGFPSTIDLLTIISGMTRTQLPRPMELYSSDLISSRTTISTIAPAWCKVGTNFASREAGSKPACLFLVMATSRVSGLASGRWETWPDLVTQLPLTACGRIATTTDVMLVSLPTRALQMD